MAWDAPSHLNEGEFRAVAMLAGATLSQVDEACRQRCHEAGRSCHADGPFASKAKAEGT